MKSQTDMLSALGGTPVAMSYGDVYTALSTGIIDGTENNETALTTGKHGEVCKVYSVDQHAMIPDVMVMSSKIWNNIEPEDQKIILECAYDATDAHKVMWDQAIDEAVEEAKGMGVEFVYDVVPTTVSRSKVDSGNMTSVLAKASWNVIRLKKQK